MSISPSLVGILYLGAHSHEVNENNRFGINIPERKNKRWCDTSTNRSSLEALHDQSWQ
jgi:hypothetical protein